MTRKQKTYTENASWLGICALLAAIGASACCVLPLLLLSVGIGGAWISTLTSMQHVRPYFLILSVIFIALGYRKLYISPRRCNPDAVCATSDVQSKQRLIFWLGSAFVLLLLAFPWYAPLFME